MIFGAVSGVNFIKEKGKIYRNSKGEYYLYIKIISGWNIDMIPVIMDRKKIMKIKVGDILLIEDKPGETRIAGYYYRVAKKVYRYSLTKKEVL